MESDEGMTFTDKIIMGPMVHVSLLPARLLALDYGADLVYSEEVIDFKILNAKRKENAILNTIDFVLPDDTVVFQTCQREKQKVIFQMGTANGKRALAAARKVEKDVAGIDVNMGCPKSFSIHGGMGAALLTKPDQIKEILTTLVSGLSIPVTCKIRILPTLDETLKLVKLIESTGVKAIAVHGRTKEERPRHANHNDFIRAITETVSIPVIANGGSMNITEHSDIEVFRNSTGASSVMLARAAMWNYSIFRKDSKLPIVHVLREFIKYTIQYEIPQPAIKYCILRSLQDDICNVPQGEATQHAYTTDEICAIWGLADYYKETTARLKQLRESQGDQGEATVKRRKSDDGRVLIEMPLKYIRKYYRQGCSPKLILYEYTKKNNLSPPEYQTTYDSEGRLFHSTVIVDNVKYSAPSLEKSKKCTEQAAALVFLKYNKLRDPRMMSPTDAFLNQQQSTEENNVAPQDGKLTEDVGGSENLKTESGKIQSEQYDFNSDVNNLKTTETKPVSQNDTVDNLNGLAAKTEVT